MIVSEHRIRDIVDTIPSIRVNSNYSSTPNFHWGDEKELNRWLQEKKEAAYPLIWLLPTPDDYKSRGFEVEKKCEFIISTRENATELYNDQRYIKSFETVLNPITERLIHGLNTSSISDLIKQEWVLTKFPNYSNSSKNATIDLWDAVKLVISVRFNDNCLNTINYGKL